MSADANGALVAIDVRQPQVEFSVLAGYTAFRVTGPAAAAVGDEADGAPSFLRAFERAPMPEPQARLRRVLHALLANKQQKPLSALALRHAAGLTGKQSPKNEITLLRSYFVSHEIDPNVLPRWDGYRIADTLAGVDLWDFWRLSNAGIESGQCQEPHHLQRADRFLRYADELWLRAARLDIAHARSIPRGSLLADAICKAYDQRLYAKRELANVRAANRRMLERLQDEIEVWWTEPTAHPNLYAFLESIGAENPVGRLEKLCRTAASLLRKTRAELRKGPPARRKEAHLNQEQMSDKIERHVGRYFPKDDAITGETPTVNMSWQQFDVYANRIVSTLKENEVDPQVIVAVARGGLPLATRLAVEFRCRFLGIVAIERYPAELAAPQPEEYTPICTETYFPVLSSARCVLIVDDVSASGKSRSLAEAVVAQAYPDAAPDNFWYACLLADTQRMCENLGDDAVERLAYGRQMRSQGQWVRMPWEHWDVHLDPEHAWDIPVAGDDRRLEVSDGKP
ncbi:MAG: Phosphoribosyl transferase domain [Acidobacteriota bacterium]|jgi:hypoxanthine phosphoribosyltransferase|nr:Phosphoribosyl transferase domain [Acidobacteriota bacterium]